MASTLKINTLTGVTTAGSIAVTGEGNSTTTNLQQGLAKSWLSYNGDSASTRDSFNVSSVTDNGTGDYTTNIDNDMNNSSYAVTGAISAAGSANSNVNILQIHSSGANTLVDPSTGAFRAISIHDANDALQDVDYFTVSAHGDLA